MNAGKTLGRPITSEIFVAFTQCPLKAFNLLFEDNNGVPHEYVRITEDKARRNQNSRIRSLNEKSCDVRPYDMEHLKDGSEFLVNAVLEARDLRAECGVLARCATPSALGEHSYEPTLFLGTHSIPKEKRRELCFAGHVLTQIQHTSPVAGRLVGADGKAHKFKLDKPSKTITPVLGPLREWISTRDEEVPPLVLNKYCDCCEFRGPCEMRATMEDNISLLSGVTPKMMRVYKKRGIFTVKQLSYTYRVSRKKRRNKARQPTRKPELQALAIRTGKVFLLETPQLPAGPVELVLDIEGNPDEDLFYLFGLLISDSTGRIYRPFWANDSHDEADVWQHFLETVSQYPDAPIYHFGSYESKAVEKLARRYACDGHVLTQRLVNVNKFIYGKVYFPVRSHSLKHIGRFLGVSWTSPEASGLQTLVWRHRWDETQDPSYRNLLLTYNEEDCCAVRKLVDELSQVSEREDLVSDADFPQYHKPRSARPDNPIHGDLDSILRFAHGDWDTNEVYFDTDRLTVRVGKKKRTTQADHTRRKRVHRPTRAVQVPSATECLHCGIESMTPCKRMAQRVLVDLVFTKRGVRKTVTKYWGFTGRCQKCGRYRNPPQLTRGHPPLYGQGFKVWITYQRLLLGSPYTRIRNLIEDVFHERMPETLMRVYIRDTAARYYKTENLLIDQIRSSPFVHADETTIKIRGVSWYVWVFTDGSHVVFKLSETRETSLVHELVGDYGGVLVSDFYPGYDAVKCRQQKCWVHLIRELNNDLWKAPYDTELAAFAQDIKDLIVPILACVQKHGLRKRNLGKFRKQIEQFYSRTIDDQWYKSDNASKFQSHFSRYRHSLFTFLDENGIPWHNNVAENAIRPIVFQRGISGSFSESMTHEYLRLLSVSETCRFQGKSLLKFLLSGETDLDEFRKGRRRR